MIYLLLGRPGGGKSYEATVFHVLPALMDGRKVITNLPLNIEALSAIVPNLRDLLVIRRSSLGGGDERVFSSIDDYGDEWRHPKTGSGPLYVVDECHKAVPKIGTGRDVEEWYAEHRHETADVLLISQSYGKLNRAIVDLVDVCYQVAKATALGSQDHYVRKVRWGVRGEIVNTSIRKYEPQYFKLYQSHTRGGGVEVSAKDIKPIWMHWSVLGGGALVVLPILFLIFNGFDLFPEPKTADPKSDYVTVTVSDLPAADVPQPPPPARAADPLPEPVTQPVQLEDAKPESPSLKGPFDGMGFHLAGWLQMRGEQRYIIALSQNGVVVRMTNSDELVRVGYRVQPVGECAMRAGYGDVDVWVRCDMPTASVSPFSGVGTRSQPEASGKAAGGSPALAGEAPPT